ncbi:AraC family transcriptional regulator [Bacillus sp. 1P06AnD]|uniref:AraC family transcriptional regulator n=1 Tax=Bacillus sp. 1P06AnD TaxID=3132208 RepID=UPI0039A24A04
MQPISTIQSSIDYIEQHLKERLTAHELAAMAGYSTYHFYTLFNHYTGSPVMDYINKRRLQHALWEIRQGKKIIDAAFEYGFETHAGFTKAFKRCFGSPPSLYSLHCPRSLPPKPNLSKLLSKKVGGTLLQPKMIKSETVFAIGYEFIFQEKEILFTRDAPAFWSKEGLDDGHVEAKLYEILSPIKHGEYCINIRKNKNQFVYLFALSCEAEEAIPDGMKALTLPPADYAVFKTPLVPPSEFTASITGTWNYILEEWLPSSGYEVDERHYDFELYDELCHSWVYDKVCMYIYLPLLAKEV